MLHKQLKPFRGKNAKNLLGNFAWLSILQIASYIFPLITMPYLARIIGVEGYGKIAFANAIMIWIQTISDWGFHYTATRDVAQNRDDKQQVSIIFSKVLWARCLLVFLSFLLLVILIITIPKFREESSIIIVSFLMIPGHVVFPDWFFQAIERMKYITILNLLMKLMFTLLIFVVIKEKNDYIFQPLLISLGYLFAGAISLYIIIIKWGYKLVFVSLEEVVCTIKNSTNVFINNLMPNLYNSFSMVLLGFWGGTVSNGILTTGEKFVGIAQQFMGTISRTFFPFLSRHQEKHSLYAKINVWIALVSSFLLYLLAPLLIDIFFTKDFADSILVMRILSVSIVFLSLSNVYGTNYMIILGYEKVLRNITSIVSVVGFALSFPLIYYFDYIGAAITITLTRVFLGMGIMCKAKSMHKRRL